MTAATHSEFSIKSNFCLKDIPTSPGLCFDEEKVHNSSLLQIVSCECATARVGGARPLTIDAWQGFLFDIRDCMEE